MQALVSWAKVICLHAKGKSTLQGLFGSWMGVQGEKVKVVR